VSKLYDTEAEGEQGCPGQDNCPTFRSSAADQPIEARCPHCPKRTDGRRSTVDGHDDNEAFIDQIEILVHERNSGFGFPDDLTLLEKELIIIWDEATAQIERAIKIRTLSNLAAVLTVKTLR
jgi:hypothetical protein